MAALYSSENFPLPVVEELPQLGHDVLTIQEAALFDSASLRARGDRPLAFI